MGGLLIKNNQLRCKDCFKLYTFKIIPDFPLSRISRTCNCSKSEMEVRKFLNDYKKNKNLSISCSKCNKENPKDPKYCNECKKIYCINCSKAIHNEKNNNLNHKLIVIEKYDYFCIHHQNDNFVGYCKTCKMDICKKCVSEKLHNDHKILIYQKIYDEKKMREYLKKAIKSAEIKIDYNNKITLMMCKEIKKNETKTNIKNLSEINEDENKKILEFINILYEIYDLSKNKNYSIIMNMIDNIDFNFERIKFEKKSKKENDIESLKYYLKTDFILKTKPKPKEQIPLTLEEQLLNDNIKVPTDNVKKEEEKKEKEKKEEERKEEENKEEKRKEEEDDGHEKTMQEKKEIIEKKIGEKGGYQNVNSESANNNTNNDISRDIPNNVVEIINNQTINKKNKKKPRKINFQS